MEQIGFAAVLIVAIFLVAGFISWWMDKYYKGDDDD